MEKFYMKENLNVLIFKLDKHIAMLEFSREQIFLSVFSSLTFQDFVFQIHLIWSFSLGHIISMSWESWDRLGWKRRWRSSSPTKKKQSLFFFFVTLL